MKLKVILLITLSYSYGKRYYSYYNSEKYLDAVRSCFDNGKEIATAKTKEDYIDLENFCEHKCESHWIGLGYNDTEGGYQWSDGTLMDVVDWAQYEPNRENGERCALVKYDDMKWDTRLCRSVSPFVCVDFSENPKYTLNTENLNHDDASKHCLQNNGILPIIKTPTDRERLKIFLTTQNFPRNVRIWIGLKKQSNDDTYRWINGEDLNDFYRWRYDSGTTNNYVHVHYDNSLYLHATSNSDRQFICQETTKSVKAKKNDRLLFKRVGPRLPFGGTEGNIQSKEEDVMRRNMYQRY